MTYKDTLNVISSREWGSGAMPCASLGGLTIAQFGQALVPANLSARQAKEMGLLTSGICGPHSSTSSRLADRSASLVNRLRARTAELGSTLYHLTWKRLTTPAGQSLYALRGSAQRTSETGFTGWPTPIALDASSTRNATANRSPGAKPANPGLTMTDAATLAGWPTPTKGNGDGGQVMTNMTATGRRPDGSKGTVTLPGVANLAGWGTPMANNKLRSEEFRIRRTPNLEEGARLAGWATPMVRDPLVSRTEETIYQDRNGRPLNEQAANLIDVTSPARLLASGQMQIGFCAVTPAAHAGGQLNPAHSRWLMGLPTEWDAFAPPATRSTRKSRKNS